MFIFISIIVTSQTLSPEAMDIYRRIVNATEMDTPNEQPNRKKRALPVAVGFLVRWFVRAVVIRGTAELDCRIWDAMETSNPPDWR